MNRKNYLMRMDDIVVANEFGWDGRNTNEGEGHGEID